MSARRALPLRPRGGRRTTQGGRPRPQAEPRTRDVRCREARGQLHPFVVATWVTREGELGQFVVRGAGVGGELGRLVVSAGRGAGAGSWEVR